LLISCFSCSQADYQKVDKILGIEVVSEDSTTVKADSGYYIIPDSTEDFNPFVETPYDSGEVATKANLIKEKVLSSPKKGKKPYPPPVENGWRKNPNLVRAYEERKAYEQAIRELSEINKLTTKKDTAKK
jgi:hypothetical protein